MDEARRKRVNRIKKIILFMVAAIIISLLCVCVVLSFRIKTLKKELAKSKEKLEIALEIKRQVAENNAVSHEKSIFDQDNLQNNEEDVADTEPYYIYLTFDDGPSENTEEILRILREYGVQATFFVNGKTDSQSLELYTQIARGGHTLGMHSYSHKYSDIYDSVEGFTDDMLKLRRLLKENTGVTSVYYRFPGGSSTTATGTNGIQTFIDVLHENGIEYVDWNIDSQDGAGKNLTAEELVDNVFNNFGVYHTNVVLLHDGPGHKTTVEALPRIIERARDMGARLVPINEETAPVQHR